MKIWIFNTMMWPYGGDRTAYPFPPHQYDHNLGHQLIQDHLNFYIKADELGYDGIGFAEHHYGANGICPSPNIMAAAVATRTQKANIVLLGNSLPLHANPVRLAEELAMLDLLSNGRLVAGFGRGAKGEYKGYNVDHAESRSRFEEAWELIMQAWTDEETFSWHGKHFNFDVVSILPRPIQNPFPPVIIAARSAESLEWAAKHHVPVADNFMPITEIKKTFDHYDQYSRDQLGWNPDSDYHYWASLVYVAETTEKARREAEEHILTFYRENPGTRYSLPQLLKQAREQDPFQVTSRKDITDYGKGGDIETDFTLDDLEQAGLCIVGDPEYVTQQILKHSSYLGIGTFLMYLPYATLTAKQAESTLELFAREVMPHLRKTQIQV